MRATRFITAVLALIGAGLPVRAEEGGSAAQALITPHIGTIFWTLVTFLLMLFILRRFAWKPLLGALDARESAIQESLAQARGGREDADKLLSEHKDLLAEAHRERSAALEQGRKDAETLKAEILEQAGKQREQLLTQTEAQIEAGMRQARSELRGITADLAIQAAEKLLSRNLDDPAQRRLVEDYLADLEKSGGSGAPTA
jgi:F-type H+-transporting ATPase subunit b